MDIYRSANVIIREHGEDASIEAAMQAEDRRDWEHAADALKGIEGKRMTYRRTGLGAYQRA